MNFWQVVKKKLPVILGWTIGITFVVVKVIDALLNWVLNRKTAAYGVQYNVSAAMFSPVIFIVLFVGITKYIKKRLNGGKTEGEGMQFKYHRGFTWKDIYRDREAFSFFVLMIYLINGLLYIGIRSFSKPSGNYAIISSQDTPISVLPLVSIVLAVIAVVFLENTVVGWLIKTKRGNQVLGKLVLFAGILTACVMGGVHYLWTPSKQSVEDFQMDAIIDFVTPFDFPTVFFGILTIWLAFKARKYAVSERKTIMLGVVIAVVSVIISFTPLNEMIQMMFMYLHYIIVDTMAHLS